MTEVHFQCFFALLSCQLIAGVSGFKFCLSQNRNVDLCTASPMHFIVSLIDFENLIASEISVTHAVAISIGSDST